MTTKTKLTETLLWPCTALERQHTAQTSCGDQGSGTEGKQSEPIKAKLVLLMHMISTMPTDTDPFSVSTSGAVGLCV